jgi:4-amino-4-deoxy-L-arabinose transferase-like glycosyltransferase
MTQTFRTPKMALAAILAVATVLYGWTLGSRGWGNSYYSAAVKSMGRNWTNFLFGSYDPAGVITVDKPPAALWPQVISAKIFGLHGWSVLLPQVIEGVLAIALLYLAVRRWAGELAALVAAVVLTLTPITVAINRDNNPDTLLVLVLVGAAYALTRALQAPAPRAALIWLSVCGFLVGAGFLTKMLAAWMVLPAFAVAWLVGARLGWWSRIWRLLVAGAVTAASSLWWVLLVAIWPGDRPYIGGSTNGSAWDLVIGYNGLGRVFGEHSGPGSGGGFGAGGGISFGGAAGWDRMFNDVVAGQISWLLPACGVALVVAVVVAVLHRRAAATSGTPLAAAGWVMWGGWLLVCAAVFSTQQGIFHPYYTTQLAPAAGALCGGLVTALLRAHRAGGRWAPPVAAATVAGTVAWAVVVISRDTSWYGWLRWVILAAGVMAVCLLVLGVWRRRVLVLAVLSAALAVLASPAVWAASVTWSDSAMGGVNPTAGPAVMSFPGGGPRGMEMPGGGDFPGRGGLPDLPGGGGPPDLPGGGGPPDVPGGAGLPDLPGGGAPDADSPNGGGTPGDGRLGGGGPAGGFGAMGGATLTVQQRKILDYAVKESGNARISLAVEGGAMGTSAYILNSDATVIGMGGFSGGDDAPSVDQLQSWVSKGDLRYILGSGQDQQPGAVPQPGAGSGQQGMPQMGFGGGAAQGRAQWLAAHCTEVPASAYGGEQSTQTGGSPFGASTLYDCAPHRGTGA